MKNSIDDYLIVHKSLLPACYDGVIKAKALLDSDKTKNVKDVCLEIGISRSSYYKFKDLVFKVENHTNKVLLSFNTDNGIGILSTILNTISHFQANVASINQEVPINNNAHITITIDIDGLLITISELVAELKKINHVKSVEIIGFE